MSYEIEYYRKSNGRKPVEEFLLELQKKNKRLYTRTARDILLLKQFGRNFWEPCVKSMGVGLYELRSKSDSGITRIFYFFYRENKIILTNGFIKKTQKTPAIELEKARRYKKEYEEKHG